MLLDIKILFRSLALFFLTIGAASLLPMPVLAQQPAIALEGTLNIVWGDPHPDLGSGGETRYTLESLNPATLPPQFAGRNRVRLQMSGREAAAAYLFGKRVTIAGHPAPGQSGAPGTLPAQAADVVVDSIADASPQFAATAEASVFGTKKVISLLLRFSDDAAVPHPPVFYTDMTNPDTPPAGEVFPTTINGFFKKTSWNQFSWVGDVGGAGGLGAPGGWLVLPHPKSYYANCGWSSSCALLSQLGDDGTALGRAAGINFKVYDNINFVLSNDLDCCAWGGGYSSSVDNKSYGATWEPPWGQDTGTYTHEMGHSIGLPHSGWVYYAYDSPWDMMSSRTSASSVLCGSYISKNSGGVSNLSCTEPGDGYIAPHKDFLGWIPSANEVVLTAGASASVTLEADALPLASAVKMIKICLNGFACTGGTARYYTVEARVKALGAVSQYDNAIPGEGILIQQFQADRGSIGGSCFFNNQSGWVVPVDATPSDYDSVACNAGGRAYPNYGLYNAQWLAGQSYSSPAYGFRVNVVSRTGSTFVISFGPLKKARAQMTGD